MAPLSKAQAQALRDENELLKKHIKGISKHQSKMNLQLNTLRCQLRASEKNNSKDSLTLLGSKETWNKWLRMEKGETPESISCVEFRTHDLEKLAKFLSL